MLIKVYGSAIHGVSAQTITIEVNVDTGHFPVQGLEQLVLRILL
ncbi:hypothetical protein [Chryseobacterium sp. C3]|nr:hypothetical protein [Chryseobacterium sp. C3]